MQPAREEVQDLKRIRYVTENYERLQGLRAVAMGIVLVLFGGGLSVSFLMGFVGSRTFQTFLWGVCVLATLLLPIWAESYYGRRFGRVRSRWTGLSRYDVMGMLLVLAFAWGLLAAIEFYGEGMERFMSSVAPGAYFGGLIVYAWWPKRSSLTAYWPILAVLVVGAGPLLSLAGQISGWQLILPMIAVLGIASIVGGFLDHLLLTRTMKSLPEEDG